MRRLVWACAAAAGVLIPAMACAQPAAPTEGKVRLNYSRWDAMSADARRWDSTAFARFSEGDQRWGEAKEGPRSARIGYGLSERTELFVGVTKSKRPDTFEARRDWTGIQDRNRKAYSVGISKRW